MLRIPPPLLVVIVIASCGGRSPSMEEDAAAIFDAANRPDVAIPDAASPDAEIPPPTNCDDLWWWLVNEVEGGLSTVVVRVDASSLEPVGWWVNPFGNWGGAVSEQEARDVAMWRGFQTGMLMNPDDTGEVYVFTSQDFQGGETVIVNALQPMVAFAGTMRDTTAGDVLYPVDWRDPAGLGYGCNDPPWTSPFLTGFDARNGITPDPTCAVFDSSGCTSNCGDSVCERRARMRPVARRTASLARCYWRSQTAGRLATRSAALLADNWDEGPGLDSAGER